MAALYSSASQIVGKVLCKQGAAKALAINSSFPKKKKLYAIVCETLKYKVVVDEILEQTRLLKLEKKLKYNYALVMMYDFLFGQGLQCNADLKQCILKHKAALQSSLARLKVKAKVHRNQDLLPQEVRQTVALPRYVRVNKIKTTLPDVVQHFRVNGYELMQPQEFSSIVAKNKHNPRKIVMCDEHLPDVLVFSPETDLHRHPLYLSGHILLQDKASCLPAHVLAPPPGSWVIDACAAPGNKSSHVASLMNNQGRIFAFDSDSKRLAVMQELMGKAGVNCVTTRNCNFLDVNPSDDSYRNVQYITVDPSCSGSGIVSRMDCIVNKDENVEEKEKRLESLAKFQLSALNHALSFPSVKRVVYSTCSIYQKENEDVVEGALKHHGAKFELGHALPLWPHRGFAVFSGAEKCIRASPQEDHTNGFFVALFVRKEDVGDKNRPCSGSVGLSPPPTKRRKKTRGDNSFKCQADAAVSCAGNSLSSSGKRRKMIKKSKRVEMGKEPQITLPLESGANNAKRQAKRRKKGKKVPVCS